MKAFVKPASLLSATLSLSAGSAHAAVLAATDFDGRTASGPTASNLNWTLNGLDDPGSITNDTANLFDGSTITQNNFTPGTNVGNNNSSWIADVAVTVADGFVVTLEDVTFNAVSINGGQALNVNRRNDYRVSLISPSNVTLETIDMADVVSGTTATPQQPQVTIDFADVLLALPGTYTLRIQAGDFLGANETGNHTGLDNLSINGTASPAVVPEPASVVLLAAGGLLLVGRRRRA